MKQKQLYAARENNLLKKTITERRELWEKGDWPGGGNGYIEKNPTSTGMQGFPV
jgi:hypothetical protein